MEEDRIDSMVDLAKVKAEFEQTEKMLDVIIAKKAQAAGNAASGGKASGEAAGYKETKDELEKLSQSQKEALRLAKEKEVQDKKLITLQEKIAFLSSEDYKNQQILNTELKKKKALTDAQIKADLTEIGSQEQLRAKAKELTYAYDAMGEAKRKNTKEGQALEKELTALNEKINENSLKVKFFKDNIGNYESGFTSVRAELRQTRNELATMIATGAKMDNPEVIKLAKRFDTLSDSMAKAKNASKMFESADKFEGFVKTVTAVSAAFEVATATTALFGEENKDLQKVMLKVQAAIAMTHGLEVIANAVKKEGIVVTWLEVTSKQALTAATAAYNVVVGTSTGLMKAFRLALAATGIGLAVIAVAALVENWNKLKVAMGGATESQKLNNEISKKASESYSKDIANLEILRSKITDVNSSKEMQIKAISDYNKIADKSNQIDVTQIGNTEKINKLITEQENLIIKRATQKAIEGEIESTISAEINRQMQVKTEGLQSQTKWYQTLWNVIKSGGNASSIAVDELTTGVENDAKARGEAAAKIKILTNEMLKLNVVEKEEIKTEKDSKDSKEKLTDSVVKLTKAEIDRKLWLASITTYTNEAKFAELQYLESLVLTNFATDEQIKKYQALGLELKSYIDSKKDLVGIDEELKNATESEIIPAVSYGDKELEALKKQQDLQVEADKEFAEKKTELYKEMYNTLKDLGNSYFAAQYMQLEEQAAADNAAKALELKNSNNSSEAKNAIEAKYAVKEEERAKKKRKLDHDKAVADKAFAAMGVVLNTALAISKTIAEFVNPIIWTPLVALEATMGALQLATIMAQPIPAYAKGRKGGKSENAIVGEEGFEGVWDKAAGKLTLTPDHATIMPLPAGADVIPHNIMQSIMMNTPDFSNLSASQQAYDLSRLEKKLDSLENVIKNKKELHFIGTEKGFTAISKKGASETKYIQDNILL